jgi:hypothetical protein
MYKVLIALLGEKMLSSTQICLTCVAPVDVTLPEGVVSVFLFFFNRGLQFMFLVSTGISSISGGWCC